MRIRTFGDPVSAWVNQELPGGLSEFLRAWGSSVSDDDALVFGLCKGVWTGEIKGAFDESVGDALICRLVVSGSNDVHDLCVFTRIGGLNLWVSLRVFSRNLGDFGLIIGVKQLDGLLDVLEKRGESRVVSSESGDGWAFPLTVLSKDSSECSGRGFSGA